MVKLFFTVPMQQWGMPTCHNNVWPYLLALYGKMPRRAQMLQEGFIMGQRYRLMVASSE
jgi:hypothetical protein